MSNEPVERIEGFDASKNWLWGNYSLSLANSILSRLDAVKICLGCPIFTEA